MADTSEDGLEQKLARACHALNALWQPQSQMLCALHLSHILVLFFFFFFSFF
ncbi:uncharacterized protein BDV17DRAFT_258599, partial [Aspergillus undulatus]|uniref:uncharacterized protein n=1 Tax=Aspergillus undulatus TaxID=1810928 RepID=UPI003CCCF26B